VDLRLADVTTTMMTICPLVHIHCVTLKATKRTVLFSVLCPVPTTSYYCKQQQRGRLQVYDILPRIVVGERLMVQILIPFSRKS
jgi:hypothetical protein